MLHENSPIRKRRHWTILNVQSVKCIFCACQKAEDAKNTSEKNFPSFISIQIIIIFVETITNAYAKGIPMGQMIANGY